jgi:hypothetical protein
MNTSAQNLINAYIKIKEFEWAGTSHNPPEGLNALGKLADDVFILYHLRRYIRLKTHMRVWTHLKGDWREEHFKLLLDLIKLNQSRIKIDPLLNTYIGLYDIVRLPAKDPDQAKRIENFLQELRANKNEISAEDWIDALSHLSSYCTTAENNGLRHFVPLAFSIRLLTIDYKYGVDWNEKGSQYLPYTLFFNTIKQGLEVSNKFIWNKLEISFIPVTERYRGVHDWLRLFSKHYRNRLDPAIKNSIVSYLEALICFDEQDYPSAYKELDEVASVGNEIVNISARILRLQVLYMLTTHPGTKTGSYVTLFIGKVDKEIKNLNRALDYLEMEKEKYPPKHVADFRGWVKAYTMLRSMYSTIVTKGNAPNLGSREKLFARKQGKLPQSYLDYNHPRKDWLEAALERLVRTGKG